MLVPDDAIGNGPHIYIALPENYFEHVPLNATRLLWEWEAQFDPIAGLKIIAARELPAKTGWGWGRWFVEPSWNARELVRKAMEDDDLTDLLEEVEGTWAALDEPDNPDIGQPVRDSLTWTAKGIVELTPAVVPFLLGMGVIAAIDFSLGYHGLRISKEMRNATDSDPTPP
jgi:hypothetical protein